MRPWTFGSGLNIVRTLPFASVTKFLGVRMTGQRGRMSAIVRHRAELRYPRGISELIDVPHLLKKFTPSNAPSNPYQIDGKGTFWLPPLDCPRCSPWSTSGLIYPTISPRSLPFALQTAGKNERGPLSLEEWNRLRKIGRDWANDDVLIEPGARFGPIEVDVSGSPLDFTWLGLFRPLIREPVFDSLRDSGHAIEGTAARIHWNSGAPEPLIEPEIRPGVRLADKQRGKTCSICERREQVAPPTIFLDKSSYDSSVPLQRILELPTFIVASDEVREAIERRQLRGVEFERVEFA